MSNIPHAGDVGPLGFIQAAIAEGRTSTASLQAYRDAGGAIRTQRWYRAWGELGAEISRVPMVQAAPINRQPTGEEISRVAGKGPPRFVFYGGVQVVERETGLVQTLPAAVRSTRLLTYMEAIEAMQTQISGSGSPPGVSVLGAFTTRVREITPLEDIDADQAVF